MKKITLTLVTIALLFAFISCDEKENKINEPEKTKVTLNSQSVSIRYDETFALEATITPEPLDLLWITNDENVAKVSQEGIIEGVHCGETTIKVKTLEAETNCVVTIEPYESFYVEPIIDWKKTYSYVKENETRPLYQYGENTTLQYTDNNELVDFVLYNFEDGKLVISGVFLNASITQISEEDFNTFFEERYDYMGSYEDQEVYETEDMFVVIDDFMDWLTVTYIDKASMKSTDNTQYIKSILNKLDIKKKTKQSTNMV